MPTTDQAPVKSTGLSRGVAGLGTLPSFALPKAGGGEVRSWDYKSRQPLVLWLTGPEVSRQALEEAVAHEPALQDEGAELLIVVRGPLEQAEQVQAEAGLQGPVLADIDGHVYARLEAHQPTLFVVDRSGTIAWRAPADGDRPDFTEALSWLAYLNILEPECGTCVPAWPVE